MKGLGARIRLARIAKNLTQVQLAKKVHTNQETISEYELERTGKYRPDINLLSRIAKALDVSLGWLFEGN